MKSQFQSNCNITPSAKEQKVPRPLNCFMTYRLEKQREIVGRCPGANHRDISKIIAKWWKELSAEEKEPYRLKAEKARIEHRKMYPGYKFCPKKKLNKPRAYKKRPENQFTARDHEDEQALYRLYHDGKDISLPSGDGERFPLLLDAKETKASNGIRVNKKNDSLGRKQEYHLGYTESLPSINNVQLNSSPYNAGLLYPPTSTGNLLYPQQLHSPSASPYTVAHSPSTSSYTTGYYSSSEEPAQEVSYNLYYTQCRYDGVAPHAYYSSPAQYFSAPRGYYYNTSSPLYDSPKSPQSIYVDETTTVTPSLLTSAFYYQQ